MERSYGCTRGESTDWREVDEFLEETSRPPRRAHRRPILPSNENLFLIARNGISAPVGRIVRVSLEIRVSSFKREINLTFTLPIAAKNGE